MVNCPGGRTTSNHISSIYVLVLSTQASKPVFLKKCPIWPSILADEQRDNQKYQTSTFSFCRLKPTYLILVEEIPPVVIYPGRGTNSQSDFKHARFSFIDSSPQTRLFGNDISRLVIHPGGRTIRQSYFKHLRFRFVNLIPQTCFLLSEKSPIWSSIVAYEQQCNQMSSIYILFFFDCSP